MRVTVGNLWVKKAVNKPRRATNTRKWGAQGGGTNPPRETPVSGKLQKNRKITNTQSPSTRNEHIRNNVLQGDRDVVCANIRSCFHNYYVHMYVFCYLCVCIVNGIDITKCSGIQLRRKQGQGSTLRVNLWPQASKNSQKQFRASKKRLQLVLQAQ